MTVRGLRGRLLVAAAALVMLAAAGPSGAAAERGSFADLERWLELSRHGRLVAVKARPGARLSAFVTDGCSGGLSVGWDHIASVVSAFRRSHGARPPWESCCVAHDRHYHRGGPARASREQSYDARLEADRTLAACVSGYGARRADKLATLYGLSPADVRAIYAQIADLMYWAVRVAGPPCTGLPWSWGYGWPDCAEFGR